MSPDDDSRWPWLLSFGGGLVGVVFVAVAGRPWLISTAPIVAVSGAIVVASLAGLFAGARGRASARMVLATSRLTLCLVALSLWTGAARDLWAAAAVWVAFRDADEGLARVRPLVPAAVALAIAVALNAWNPGAPAGRAIVVGVVCALAAARGSSRAADRSLGS